MFYLRFRNPGSKEEPVDTSAIARRAFSSLGYPLEPSYWERFSNKITSLKAEFKGVSVEITMDKVVQKRLMAAIEDMITVASELYYEREARRAVEPDTDVRPVVIVDEIHDILRHPTFGDQVFRAFLDGVVMATYDTFKLRVVIAKSGGGLASDSITASHHQRLRPAYQPDASLSDVQGRLSELRYGDEDIQNIISMCGGRVSLLYPFLSRSLDSAQVTAEVNACRKQAEASFDILARQLTDPAERQVMADIMDALAKPDYDGNLKPSRLPKPLQSAHPKQVLYLGEGDSLFFQSEAIRQAWVTKARANWKSGTSP